MVTLRAIPWSNFYVNGRNYCAGNDGLIQAHSDDVRALTASGCILESPWTPPPPPAPASPEPSPARATLKLKAKPYQSFQPMTGTRYTANDDGLLTVDPAHVAALIRAGCERA